WGMQRYEAWVKTCTTCHSETFARAYLEFIDKGTSHGLDKYDEAHNVVHKQFEARLLTGQRTNRPAPPAPAKALFDQFWQIYWSKNNSPPAIELRLFEMA
ncbi:MAG: hydroxylamine reductase, partial [Nitrospirae bacterium]|nr:hydroxylamine reductase [Nitrospirota bacterium]